jgi:signal transduction histidine kinase
MRPWALLSRRAFDVLVVGVAVAAQVEIWTVPVPGSKPLIVAGMLAATLPLLARRRHPLGASACVCAAVAALTLVHPRAPASADANFYALVLAMWSVGWHADPRRAVAGLATACAAVLIVTERDPSVTTADGAGSLVSLATIWVVACVLGARARRSAQLERVAGEFERERGERARVAAAQERARIAVELHDVIAHSLSVMTVQAGAARLVLDDDSGRAREPVRRIEETGRQALAEMRRLLGVLRSQSAAVELEPPPDPPAEPARPAVRRGRAGAEALGARYGFDLVVIAVFVAAEIEIWLAPVPGPKAVLVPALALATLPLLASRRFPFAAPVFVFVVQAVVTFAGPEVGSVMLSGLAPYVLASWALGLRNSRREIVPGAVIGVASVAVGVLRDDRLGLIDALNGILVCGIVCIVASVLGERMRGAAALEERAAALDGEREERARIAAAEERARIARELHDVVAHSLSVMTVQAGAARMTLPGRPDLAREALLCVAATGREALGEMRRLLGLLPPRPREPGLAPQPGLGDLEALVHDGRAAGLGVSLTVEGAPRQLSPGVDLAAYRIVQEALTNARRHAGPTTARVLVSFGPEILRLEVSDEGALGAGMGGDAGGHGLVGMRERVALYGGRLDAGPRPGGGYAVSAQLPIELP